MAEIAVALFHDYILQAERRFRDRLDPLHHSDRELLLYYRFPRHELVSLFEELDPFLRWPVRREYAVQTCTQVLITLRILASGSFQHVIGDVAGPTQPTVSRIFKRVTGVLWRMAMREVRMPSAQDQREASQNFGALANFPRVIGAIDGTHIAIKAPREDEYLFVNRKRYHSLNVQAVCSAEGLILNYNARYPGSSHDAFIWQSSRLRRRFVAGEFGDFMLIGDSGYPLEPFLMTPVRNPVTAPDGRYNRAHARTRVTIEQTFGILKSRFRCLHKSGGVLQYTPLKCAEIIASCILLHNRCIRRGIALPQLAEMEDAVLVVNEEVPRGTGVAVQRDIIRHYFT